MINRHEYMIKNTSIFIIFIHIYGYITFYRENSKLREIEEIR